MNVIFYKSSCNKSLHVAVGSSSEFNRSFIERFVPLYVVSEVGCFEEEAMLRKKDSAPSPPIHHGVPAVLSHSEEREERGKENSGAGPSASPTEGTRAR